MIQILKFLNFQQLLKCILRASSCLGEQFQYSCVRPLYFSALHCSNGKESSLIPALRSEKPCSCSDWMLQSSSGWKWWKLSIFIAICIHYWRYVVGCHWRSKVSDDCSSPFMSPHQCDLSQLKHSSTSVICMCRASFSSISSCPLALSSTDFSVCRHAIVIHRLWSNFPLNSS